MWIDVEESPTEGSVWFLIETTHETDGWTRHALSDRPPYTNQSHEPRALGWCGSRNNVSTYGRGVVVVRRVTPNGRAEVGCMKNPDALRSWLESVGYPDLLGELLEEES